MWLRVISVRTRLLLGFSVLLVLMLLVGGLAASRLGDLRQTMRIATQEVPEKVGTAKFLIDAVHEGARFKLALFAARSDGLVESSAAGVARARERINLAYEKLDVLFPPDRASESLDALNEVKRLRKIHAPSFDRAAEVKKRGEIAEADRLLANEVLPTLADYIQSIERLIEIQEQQLNEEAAQADAAASRSASLILWLCAIATLFGIGVAHVIHRSVTLPLGRLTVAARALAEGNCAVQIDDSTEKDEVGVLAAAMNEMANAERTLSDTAHRLSAGDVAAEVVVRGEQDVLGSAMVRLKQTLGELDGAVSSLTRAAREGRLDERAPTEGFQGAFRGLVSGLNATLDAMVAPTGEARRALEATARRDLSVRMPEHFAGQHGALARSFNAATLALDSTLLEVSGAAKQVSTASTQIADGAQALAQGAAEQSATLERVTDNLNRLNTVTRDNAERAARASELASGALVSSERGSIAMQRLSDAMQRIRETSDATARILKTIDEIAFQTNLLALNASVESARAGEAGRGFAVVAQEVRNLAQRCKEAARQTSALIEESVESTKQGVSLERSAATELSTMAEQVRQVGDALAHVASTCADQRDGIEDTTHAIGRLGDTTQQAAANSEESASAAQELAAQAAALSSMVGHFRLTSRRELRAA